MPDSIAHDNRQSKEPDFAEGCRKGCAACCIVISISSPLPGMPGGKPAGIRCINLDEYNGCTIHGMSNYPIICRSFKFDPALCGRTNEEAFVNIENLERLTGKPFIKIEQHHG